ncbi:hypothetical protein E2C01_047192 [Portunus trituberculatus]|uniref:Uncharacterized protein n=1 Tax=Portunus trituberculatus TaxID=210409 RepID=A0A5B7G7W2_PORTR|nr:hypothetical protein [Portunus trituberculatus]
MSKCGTGWGLPPHIPGGTECQVLPGCGHLVRASPPGHVMFLLAFPSLWCTCSVKASSHLNSATPSLFCYHCGKHTTVLPTSAPDDTDTPVCVNACKRGHGAGRGIGVAAADLGLHQPLGEVSHLWKLS